MGFAYTLYAATQQDIKDQDLFVMDHTRLLTACSALTDGATFKDKTSKSDKIKSRPPSPPDSGTTTPRLTLAPCPSRLTPFYPPPNYGCVDELKIYRSSYPQDRHVSFVKSLGIKTVLTLVDTEPTLGFDLWLQDEGIRWAKLQLAPNKDPSGRIDTTLESICEALLFIMDSANYPVYVHCNQGKHRTGCVIACLRKVQGWKLEDIINEYNTYSGAKSRAGDRALIKEFDPAVVYQYAKANGHLNGFFPDCDGRWERQRHDSAVTDIHTLRVALEAGILGVMDHPSETSSRSSSPSEGSPTPTGSRTPLAEEDGSLNKAAMTGTEYVEDICIDRMMNNGEAVPEIVVEDHASLEPCAEVR